MSLPSASVNFLVPRRSPGGAVAAPAGGRWLFAWIALRQRGIKRLVVLIVAASFLPAVTATLVCEVDCIAQALASGGQEHGEHGPATHQTSLSNADRPDAHQGACHLVAASLIAVTAGELSALPLVQDQWVQGAELRFASLIWPPPQQRPKAVFS